MKSTDDDNLIKDAETILPIDNQNMLDEQHNDEKLANALLIVGTGLISYNFW